MFLLSLHVTRPPQYVSPKFAVGKYRWASAFVPDLLGKGNRKCCDYSMQYGMDFQRGDAVTCVPPPLGYREPDKCPPDCCLARCHRKSLPSPCCWGTPPFYYRSPRPSPSWQTGHTSSRGGGGVDQVEAGREWGGREMGGKSPLAPFPQPAPSSSRL